MPNNLGHFSTLTKLAIATPKELHYIEQILHNRGLHFQEIEVKQ
jgi:hypothetical protein